MKQKELEKIHSLDATKEMMNIAAEDMPHKTNHYSWERASYNYGVYMRCHIHDGILKVAFFLTEFMRAGGRQPAYELYISKERRQFVTYDRLHDKWLNSKLDRLNWPSYFYSSKNKWISQPDHKAICDYFGEDADNSYKTLMKFQFEIREEELVKRHKKETDPWDDDLSQIPQLPKDWDQWVSKVGIRQNFIFYKYNKKGADMGYCTYCDRDVPIKNPRYDKVARCSRCRRIITFKSIGKAGTVTTKRDSIYLIQRCKDGFVIRQFVGYRMYLKGEYNTPICSCHEVRRAIFDKNAYPLRAYYWGQYKQRKVRWILTGVCGPRYMDCGKVYGKTLGHLAKCELSRTGLIELHNKGFIVDPEQYLAVLKEVPQLEKFAKADLTTIVKQCLSDYYNFKKGIHNLNASSLTGILGINTQGLKRLRRNNGGLRFLDWLRVEKSIQKPIPDNVIQWFCKEKIAPDDIQFIWNKMSIIQIHNYIKRQMMNYNKSSKEIINTWADYLSMARRLKMDVDDEIIFRVNKLYKRHDELVERCHQASFAIRAGEILERYPHVDEIFESIKEKYEYSDEDYTILVPTRIEDVLNEGRSLYHCIDGSDRYWERIERKESFIMFLRRTSDVEKAYYTLEVEPNGTIRQKRTMYDRQNPDIEEAKIFLKKWQEIIASRLTQEDMQLAEESRILRNQSFMQLRDDQIIVHTGELSGQLLVDVLLADLMEASVN